MNQTELDSEQFKITPSIHKRKIYGTYFFN